MAEERMLNDEILLGLIKANSGGGGGGTSNYNDLSNKPQIGGVTLSGDKSASDLGLADDDTVQGILDGQVIDSFSDVETALESKADTSDVKNEFIGTTEQWNALTTEQRKAYDTYQITDDFISGGGSGFVQQELYAGTSATNTYALTDNISNYDLIYVYSTNNGKYDCTSIFRSDDVLATIDDSTLKLGVFNDSEYEYFRATADNALASVQRTNRFITKIIGFKFVGSSSGGSSGGFTKDLLYSNETTTELPSSVTLLKSWKDYDALAVCFESVYQNRLYVQSSIILKEYLEIALDTSYSNGGFVPLGNTESGAYLFGKIASETEISNIYGTVLRLGTIYGLKFGSGSGSGGDGLQLYHETYTGTGTAVHVLSLQHTPVLITSLGRADGKVMISPFSPKGLAARVDWIIPNTGNGTVGISEDNGVKITGIDAGQACNTEDIEYDVYYLA